MSTKKASTAKNSGSKPQVKRRQEKPKPKANPEEEQSQETQSESAASAPEPYRPRHTPLQATGLDQHAAEEKRQAELAEARRVHNERTAGRAA